MKIDSSYVGGGLAVHRSFFVKSFLVGLSILALVLRPLFIPLLPIVTISFILLFKVRLVNNVLFLLMVIFFFSVFASSLYTGEFNFVNIALSLFLIVPVLIIFFTTPKVEDKNYFEYFIKVLTGVLVINNIIGLVQFMYAPAVNDDAFIGFYGAGGLGPHTLSLVNFIVCAYYFLAYQHSKSKIKLFLFLFFISSAILSFYGLGLIIFILSIFIYKFSLKAFFRSIFIFVLVMVMFTGLLYTFRYQTFLYNYENLQRVALFFRNDDGQKNAHQIPRKLMLYRNYVEVYLREPILFLTGSGPGTFNSRSYFLLNGDYSKHKFVIELFGQHSPRYAQKYVYPLWNSTNTGKYMDGTRNQPFSSIVALFAEFGAIVSLFISMLASNKYRSTLQKLKQQNDQGSYSANLYFLKFLTIFFVLNLFTDNFLEYPEIVMIYLFIFKTIEIKIFNSSKHSTSLIK